MTLFEKQICFSMMLKELLEFADKQGYQITLGDAYRDPRAIFPYSHGKSLHKVRLAIDLNVFRNNKLMTDGNDFRDLGEFWENIGGTWGGRFKDGNHFSIEHEGMK
jgi:hypothetical protein